MKKLLAMLFMPLFLIGCGETYEERIQRHSHSCYSYGFKSNTPEFAKCIQEEKLNEDKAAERSLRDLRNQMRQTVCETKDNKTICNQF